MISPSSDKKIPEKKFHLLDLSYNELEEIFSDIIKDQYRLPQVCKWLFEQRTVSFDTMSNLPISLRNMLSKKFFLRTLTIIKHDRSRLDETIKFTFASNHGTDDKNNFSAVFLPHFNYNSLCISTQVGCAWKCKFCASGLIPFQRNLSSGEILDQIFLTEEETKLKIQNILFMGMGEPLANYQETLKTIQWLSSSHGFKINPHRITLSTTGLAPQIKKIAEQKTRVNLALSLHAPTDDLRKKIMPISARYMIRDIMDACKFYQQKNNSDLTIEYILLKNVNDQLKHAEQLAKLIQSVQFDQQPKINLIPYNPVSSLSFQTSEPGMSSSFFKYLKQKRFIVHTRKPQGQDINASCGQLL